jgi:glutamate racemase
LLKSAIARVFGNHVKLVDSGEAVSLQLKQDFESQKLARNSLNHTQSLRISLTDKSEHFEALSTELLKLVSVSEIQFETVSVI